jgi:hypothetical protein
MPGVVHPKLFFYDPDFVPDLELDFNLNINHLKLKIIDVEEEYRYHNISGNEFGTFSKVGYKTL